MWVLVLIAITIGSCRSIPQTPIAYESSANKNSPMFKQQRELHNLLQKAKIPGASIAIVRNHRIREVLNDGKLDSRKLEQVTGESIYEAASLSKVVFATLVAEMIFSGKLHLDQKISEIISIENFSDQERARKITIRNLLSHMSGLPNGADLDFSFTPGAGFHYSGVGYQVLQQLVEKIQGKDLEYIAQSMLLQPLGMTRSSFLPLPDFDDQITIGHNEISEPIEVANLKKPMARSSLRTNASDYGRFIEHILADKKLLQFLMQIQYTLKKDELFPGNEQTKGKIHWGLGVGLDDTESRLGIWHWVIIQVVEHSFMWISRQVMDWCTLLMVAMDSLSLRSSSNYLICLFLHRFIL